ncbi:MAG: hypothetical protein CSYNP_03899 [Syntrophus sp. SKADARSKE-3]|nr:hypothetical protein [Syntrophus sp. SKADARSKE-3]
MHTSNLYDNLNFKRMLIMATIMPEGENIQRAIKWISMSIEEDATQSIAKLVEKAVFKFDLSPVDSEFLIGFFRKRKA